MTQLRIRGTISRGIIGGDQMATALLEKNPRTIRCLGVPEVRIAGEPQHLTKQQRRLFAVLAAAGPSGIEADGLLEELYQEKLPVSRTQAIYSLIGRLDADVSPFVVNKDGRYRVANDVAVDTWLFTNLASAPEPDSIVSSLTMWRGRPFESVEAGPILFGARSDLHRTRSEMVQTVARIASREQLGQIERQIQHSIDDDPYNEPLAIAGAGALYRLGRRRDALGILQICRARLRNDLGLDAGAELDDAELSVLQQRDPLGSELVPPPTPVSGAKPSLPALLVPRSEDFVGRQQPLDALGGAFDSSISDRRGRVVVVSGPAGMGKSELVAQFAATQRHGDIRVAPTTGAASVAYAAWVGALPELAGDVEDLGRASDSGIAHIVFWKSVERVLARLASASSLVVVLEDMHEGDPQSVLLLQWLASSALPSNLLIVVTTREPTSRSVWGQVLPELSEASTRGLVTMIELEPLRLSDIQRLVASRFADESPARQHRFAAQVHSLSQGNPLVSVALIADSESADDLVTSTTKALEEHHSQAILNRVDAAATGVLTNAALIGREFDLDLLAELCEMSALATLAHLEAAMTEGLIFEADDVGQFRFNHVLTAEAFARRSSTTGRTRKFVRLARNADLPPADRVRYVRGAADQIGVAEATSILADAAHELVERLAFSEAQSAYELAVSRLTDTGEVLPVELLTQRADAASRAGDLGRLTPYRQEAFEAARATGSSDSMAEAALAGLPASERSSGDPELFALLQQIDPVRIEDSATRERFTYNFARSARILHQPDVANRILDSVDVDQLSSPESRALFESERFALAGQERFVVEAAPTIEALLAELPPGTTRTTLRSAHLVQSLVAQDPRATGEIFEQARAEVLEHPVPRARWTIELNEVMLAQLGMIDSSNDHSAVLATGFRLGVTDALEAWGAQCWQKYWVDSQFAEALELIDNSVGLIDPNVGWRSAEAFAAAETGDDDRAREALDEVSDELRRFPSDVWSPVAAALTIEACSVLRSGVDDALDSAVEVLYPHSGSAILLGIGAAYFGPADGFVGRALRLVGHSDAGHFLARAEEQALRTGATYWLERTRRLAA